MLQQQTIIQQVKYDISFADIQFLQKKKFVSFAYDHCAFKTLKTLQLLLIFSLVQYTLEKV